MSGRHGSCLLADVGGTNVRLALLENGRIRHEARYAVADFAGPAEAIEGFLAETAPATGPRRAALAFAGPVKGEAARLTNGAWEISAAALRRAFGFERVRLVNDFAGVAWSLPRLTAADLVAVGGGAADAAAPKAAIGPGTGLGVAGFVPDASRPRVLTTEGGHVTMAAADRREAAILEHLRARFGHVSAERVLSGAGLENLYRAVIAVDGLSGPERSDAEIVRLAREGDCPACEASLDLFCAMLGTAAGNLALSLGALGGVYIAGGIVPRFVERFAASEFRLRFEAKGRLRDYMSRIPTWVVVHPEPAFLGLGHMEEWA